MPFRTAAVLPYRCRWSLRSILSRHPRLYLPLVRGKHPLLVHPGTELVFEGFFRCGNTFAFEGFLMAQSRPVAVARHIHAPAQVLYAVRRRIPVLLTLRDPEDCIPSLLLFEPRITTVQALKSYIGYYACLLPVLDRCVVADFDRITNDFSEVCRRINRTHQANFDVFEHTPANVQACFERMEKLTEGYFGSLLEDKTCRPSAARAQRKIRIADEVERDPRLRLLRERAGEIYRACLAFC